MLGFLKKKLKKTLSVFSKDKEKDEKVEELKEVIVPSPKEPEQKTEEIVEKLDEVKEEDVKPEPVVEKKPEPILEPVVEEVKKEHVVEKVEEEKPEPTPAPVEEKEEVVEEEPAIPEEVEEVEDDDLAELEELKKMQEEAKKAESTPAPVEEKVEEPTPTEEKKKDKKGFFSRVISSISKSKITEEKFNKFFNDLEISMLENNVALEVIERIKELILENLKDKQVSNVEKEINIALQKAIEDILQKEPVDFIELIKSKPKPCIIAFFGINGGGKTTSIAKIAHLLKNNGMSCVISASDTFRAAAIHQVEEHANRLKVKLVKHDYGADPTAVAFDTVKYAQRHDTDVVLIDTAGRVHSNTNLIGELKKLVRVIQPHIKVFVGESISGNDLLEQARKFDQAVELDGIILTKADVDEKGGSMISIREVTKKPIFFLGMGQEYKDLKPFDPTLILNNLFND